MADQDSRSQGYSAPPVDPALAPGATGPNGKPLPPVPPEAMGYTAPAMPGLPFTPENVPCLRGFGGSCRHYWRMTHHYLSGNNGQRFTKVVHYCTAQAGVETELSADVPIYSCTRWDPGVPAKAAELECKRKSYYARFPAHEPKDEKAQDDD